MLWFFAALMWLAAVHLRAVNHQEDVLRRALAKQAAVHDKARSCFRLFAPEKALPPYPREIR